MSEAVRKIRPIPLTKDNWDPFGWLPVADTDRDDGVERLDFAWNDVHVNRIAHRRDEVPQVVGGLRCQVLYHHVTHTQVLMPLDAIAVVAVAPPGLDMTSPSDIDQVRAFVLEPLSSIVLRRATWHWGPFPVTADAVELFNIQGRRYLEDNASVDLEALGRPLDVLL